MSARNRFCSEMVSWLNARLVPPGTTVTAETELFSSGAIDSIKVLELIAFTERAIGRPVPDRAIRLDNFRTVNRIAAVFLREEHDDAAA